MGNTENKKTILVVEDEMSLQNLIVKILENNNFNVLKARDVDTALSLLKENSPIDVIWLDHYLLGEKNGLDFVAELKGENSRWKSIPVFVVSNTATAEKIQSYIRFGVHKYYTKADYTLTQIVNDVKQFVEKC